MIEFLVTILVLCVIIYVVHLVVGMLGLPQPIATLVYLIIGLIFLFWLLNYFGIYHTDIGNIHTHKIDLD